MIKKMFAICLLVNAGLFQGAALANTGSPIQGPGNSPTCGSGYMWDPVQKVCFRV